MPSWILLFTEQIIYVSVKFAPGISPLQVIFGFLSGPYSTRDFINAIVHCKM